MDNEDIAKRLDACKLIVVNYGTFSEFTGKAAVPTDLLGEAIACLRSPVSATPPKLSELVPTSWLDPLLTGPDAAIPEVGEPVKLDHIAELLRRLKKRIQDAEAQ